MKLALLVVVALATAADGFTLGKTSLAKKRKSVPTSKPAVNFGKTALAKKKGASKPKPAVTFNNPFATKAVAKTGAKKAAVKASSSSEFEEYFGLIGMTLVLVLAAKATIFAPPPEPTGPPMPLIVLGVLALGFGALMALPDQPKVESWYDAGIRLDGSNDLAADKAEAVLKQGLKVEKKVAA